MGKEKCYVYAIEAKNYMDSSYSFIKVGISANIDNRLKSISTGCPFDVSVLRCVEVSCRSDALKIESIMHKLLKSMGLHKRNEWFVHLEENKINTLSIFDSITSGLVKNDSAISLEKSNHVKSFERYKQNCSISVVAVNATVIIDIDENDEFFSIIEINESAGDAVDRVQMACDYRFSGDSMCKDGEVFSDKYNLIAYSLYPKNNNSVYLVTAKCKKEPMCGSNPKDLLDNAMRQAVEYLNKKTA